MIQLMARHFYGIQIHNQSPWFKLMSKFLHVHPLSPFTLYLWQWLCSFQFSHLGVERDSCHALPWKLLLGLIAFYISTASTLVSFTTRHFFIFRNQLKFVSSTSYIVISALVTLFSMAVFPLCFHLVWATLKKVPQRKYKVSIPHWLSED